MYATDFSQVGKRIQAVLHERGITQQQLADRLSISKQVMSKIINGAKAINVTEIARIADALGTNIDELLTLQATPVSGETLCFMGSIGDVQTQERVNRIREAIDQIFFLEGIVND